MSIASANIKFWRFEQYLSPSAVRTCSMVASMMKAPSKSPGALRVRGYMQGLKEK